VTTLTTLIGTLSSLSGLGVVVIKATSLVLNIFCTLLFLRHSPYLCSTLEQIIHWYQTSILIGITSCDLVFVIGSLDPIMAVCTIGTSLFQ
jgi:hypothetical protein